MTPSPEGWPTKTKEAPFTYEVRTEPTGHQPSMPMSWGKTTANPTLVIGTRWRGIHPCWWPPFVSVFVVLLNRELPLHEGELGHIIDFLCSKN